MADWKSFTFEIPGKDLLEPIREVLETLLILLDVLRAILDTIKTFLVDFGNPIRALVEALIKLIEELFLALKATGFFGYFDIPDPTVDPGFDRFLGGYQGFVDRFKGSLVDTRDFNRPQPRSSTKSGFVLLVVDASDPFALIRRIKQLLRFFGKEFTSPRYEAPINFKIGPVGQSGDPIIDVASVFTDGPIEAINLSWTLPTSSETPDPGFSDLVTKVAAEFVPPSFVIEKSVDVNPAGERIDIAAWGDPAATGITYFDRPTAVDPTLASRFAQVSNGRVTRREILADDQGDPVVKFQQYIPVPVGVDILGQLGRFRYIDSDVEVGRTYYYRVRPYSGSLDIDENTNQLNGVATSVDDLEKGISGNAVTPFFKWPSADDDDEVVMGKPTALMSTTVPEDLGDFDVVTNLRKLFLTAFSLDFHLQLPEFAEFDSQGDPVPPTPLFFIGRGSLANVAGQLAVFEGQLLVDSLAQFDTPGSALNASTVAGLTMPWQEFLVRRQAFRIADGVLSAMLQFQQAAFTFRDFMRGPLPSGPISTQGKLAGKTNLEEIVFAFTDPEEEPDEGTNDEATLTTFANAYINDPALRKNILVVINFLKTFTLGGAPVDWISIVPLRDIIPWAGQILYDILDKIDALLAAFNGILDEIRQFIELLERKIDALERFIQFLIDILNFIESLQLGVFILNAAGIEGDVFQWFNVIDTAGGDVPPSGPGGYSAGIGLAYVAPNVDAFVTAFTVIFGG